jgi:Predicted metal-dependent enzyme
MRYSGIGGQAVLEGIMMKNAEKYSVAVRCPDGSIASEVAEYRSITEGHKWMEWPILRGVFRFVDSLKLGMKTLTYSAEMAGMEEPKEAEQKDKKSSAGESLVMGGAILGAVAMALGLFVLLPVLLANLLKHVTESSFLIGLCEGLLRLIIFIVYVKAISLMKDIRRTYMYHGAEHKCINCIEHGLPLTVENVRASSKEHKRCGTSFMLFVMLISIIVFMFVRFDNVWLRMASRLVLIPVVAGVSYEFIRLAGSTENRLVNAISKPGLWMQRLTTKEPEDDMIEVAIRAVEDVFDWQAFEAEMAGTKS